MKLTQAETKWFTGAMVVNCGVTIAISIASRVLVKRYDKMVQEVSDTRELAMELGRIANYQKVLLEKHRVELDEFDLVVFDDMNTELIERLKQVGYSEPTEEES